LLQLDFLVYSRDAADAAELRDDRELLEEHWSYMERFAESMIARGPTLDSNRETATGRLHVLSLPGVDAVRESRGSWSSSVRIFGGLSQRRPSQQSCWSG
jgi:hypothetical protein